MQAIQIYGWLPVDTRRNNLHQLLFCCGVTVAKDADGNMVFGFPDTETIKDVPDSRIFLGGNVDYMTPATRVEVTEHAFMRLPSDTTVTLYDNTDGTGAADHTLIIFQEAPVYDLKVSGSLRIIESGVNHAVVSGTGVLTGRKYTHTTKIISRDTGATGDQKTVSVTDVTLVNVANSDNVAKRVLSYQLTAADGFTLPLTYYYKTADGIVHLVFGVKKSDGSAITEAWTIFATLPAGYRPYNQIFPAAVNQAGELVKICIYGSNGTIRVHDVAPPSGTTEIYFVTSFVAEN